MDPTALFRRNAQLLADRLIDSKHTLDTNCSQRHIPLDNGRHGIDFASADLGELSKLPLEIIHNILMLADIQSLTHFRRVNMYSMRIVDFMSEYQTVFKYAPALLRGSLATGAARYITCSQLYHALTSTTCASCAKFGAYIYLLRAQRICFRCYSQAFAYQPLSATEIKQRCNLSIHKLKHIPQMKSVPGSYSWPKRHMRRRLRLYDAESVFKEAFARDPKTTRVSIMLPPANRQPLRQYAYPNANSPHRFMAIVSAPAFGVLGPRPVWPASLYDAYVAYIKALGLRRELDGR